MNEPDEHFRDRMGPGLAIVLILTFWSIVLILAKLVLWLITLY